MGRIFKYISIFSHEKSKQSIQNVKAVFSRRNYQSNSGNIAYSHIILAVDWEKIIEEESVFVIFKTWTIFCI